MESKAASPWVQRWSHLLAPGGKVLDVACGHGRHALWMHERGHPVVVVDRSSEAVAAIALPAASCEKIVADMENGPWPLAGRKFSAVVVVNYLWRPLWPTLLASLEPGGVLIYETFTQGNESVGKPSRPDFLLRTGELLECCRDLRVIAFEDGFREGDGAMPRFVQRIVAVREPAESKGLPEAKNLPPPVPARYGLP